MKMLLTLVAVAVLAPAAPAPPVSAPPRDLPAVLDQAVRDGYPGVLAYARRLEDCAREAPFNWFNFHDFWGRAA